MAYKENDFGVFASGGIVVQILVVMLQIMQIHSLLVE